MSKLLPLLLLACAASAFAQQPPDGGAAAQRAAMDKLAWMTGYWEGTSTSQFPDGQKRSVSQEWIRRAAGGLAILVQGHHRRQLPDGSAGDSVLDTAGMFTFDAATGKYRFVTQLQDGTFGVQDAEFKGDVFSWGFAVKGARIRYDITRENAQWNERGYYCRDGAPCTPFFHMVLDRKGDAQ